MAAEDTIGNVPRGVRPGLPKRPALEEDAWTRIQREQHAGCDHTQTEAHRAQPYASQRDPRRDCVKDPLVSVHTYSVGHESTVSLVHDPGESFL
jgi:hypothetical protein